MHTGAPTERPCARVIPKGCFDSGTEHDGNSTERCLITVSRPVQLAYLHRRLIGNGLKNERSERECVFPLAYRQWNLQLVLLDDSVIDEALQHAIECGNCLIRIGVGMGDAQEPAAREKVNAFEQHSEFELPAQGSAAARFELGR